MTKWNVCGQGDLGDERPGRKEAGRLAAKGEGRRSQEMARAVQSSATEAGNGSMWRQQPTQSADHRRQTEPTPKGTGLSRAGGAEQPDCLTRGA